MAFLDQYDLSRDAEFLKRVEACIVKVAINVQAEDPAAVNHAARSTLAYGVLFSPVSYAALFALAVATNPVLAKSAQDDAIEFTVNSMWNAFSGGTPK